MVAEVEPNPYESARAQLESVADELAIEPWLVERLSQPEREFTTNFPVEMDDGGVRMFTGYRVQHNNARGPFNGVPEIGAPSGVRFFFPVPENVSMTPVFRSTLRFAADCYR